MHLLAPHEQSEPDHINWSEQPLSPKPKMYITLYKRCTLNVRHSLSAAGQATLWTGASSDSSGSDGPGPLRPFGISDSCNWTIIWPTHGYVHFHCHLWSLSSAACPIQYILYSRLSHYLCSRLNIFRYNWRLHYTPQLKHLTSQFGTNICCLNFYKV